MGIVILLLAAILMGLGIPMTIVGVQVINAPVPNVVVIPPMPQSPPSTLAEDAYDDAWCEFTNLFNSYSYKLSKNGRSMINGKFVAMPKGE